MCAACHQLAAMRPTPEEEARYKAPITDAERVQVDTLARVFGGNTELALRALRVEKIKQSRERTNR